MLRIHQNWFNRSRLSPLSWLSLAGVVSCFGFILTVGFMLFPTLPKEANAAEWVPDRDQAEVEIPDNSSDTSVSIGVPSTIAFDAVTPTANGATTTANANLTIATTNSASYSLYLYSSDGDNSLKSINPANTSTVDALTGGVGLTLSSLESNTWGYNLGTTEPTTDTTYNAVPTSNAEPIQTKDTSSTNSANDTYTLSFGAKVDTSIPSGTYTGTLTVAVVAEPGGIVINYDANGGYFNNDPGRTSNEVLYNVEELETQSINEPSLSANYDKTITISGATSLVVSFSCNVMAIGGSTIYLYDGSGKAVASCTPGATTGPDQINPNTTSGTFIILGDTFSIVANYGRLAASLQATAVGYSIATTAGTEEFVPTRSDYNFAGWYTDAAGTEGNEFVPNGNMVSGTTVYAKWEQIYYMQDFTNAQCQSLASDDNFTVVDGRDGSDYTVRYINGACWMTQNLRLAPGTTIYDTDSNISTESYIIPSSSLLSGNSFTEGRTFNSGNTTDGVYYNGCAASAGTACSGTAQSYTNDICPKGWRVPSYSDFETIAQLQVSTTTYVGAFSPVMSGCYFDGSRQAYGARGYFESSTAANGSYWYTLYYEGGSLVLNYGSYGRGYGASIRCIRSS